MFGKAPLCVRHGNIHWQKECDKSRRLPFSSFDAMSSPLLGASISVKFHPDKMLQPPRLQRDQWDPRSWGAESAKSIPRLPQLIPIGETRIQSALIRYWSRRRNCWIVFLLKRVVKCFTTGVKRPVALYDDCGELLKLPSTYPRINGRDSSRWSTKIDSNYSVLWYYFCSKSLMQKFCLSKNIRNVTFRSFTAIQVAWLS